MEILTKICQEVVNGELEYDGQEYYEWRYGGQEYREQVYGKKVLARLALNSAAVPMLYHHIVGGRWSLIHALDGNPNLGKLIRCMEFIQASLGLHARYTEQDDETYQRVCKRLFNFKPRDSAVPMPLVLTLCSLAPMLRRLVLTGVRKHWMARSDFMLRGRKWRIPRVTLTT